MKKRIALAIALVAVAALVMSCASGGDAAAKGGDAAASVKISMQAKDAELVTSKDLTLENGNSNIGYWSDLGDIAKWTAEVPEDGTYVVQMRYSVASSFAGAVVNVTVGDAVIEWPVASTGDWGSYKSFDVGTVDLKAGSVPVMLQAKSIKNRFVANIQRVRLIKQ